MSILYVLALGCAIGFLYGMWRETDDVDFPRSFADVLQMLRSGCIGCAIIAVGAVIVAVAIGILGGIVGLLLIGWRALTG